MTATPSPQTLGQLAHGRDNNLNLLRMAAASAVLVSHSVAITGGPGAAEPLEAQTGMTLGFLAVAVFFAISGFLITRAFERRSSLGHWLASRALRLFPGLAMVLALTMLVLGPLASVLEPSAYFFRSETWAYFPRNLFLWPMQYGLPGVFGANPYPETVNGSLWTLFYEVLCYAGVLLAGLTGLLARRWVVLAAALAMGAASALAFAGQLPGGSEGPAALLAKLGFPFALGMAASAWRDRIVMSWILPLALWLAALALSPTALAGTVLLAAISGSALWLGYAPRGPWLAYNRLGDYSYGTYLYAFPVQQTLVWLLPGHGWAINIALAWPLTLVCAVLSWRLIERRALALVRRRAEG